nr:hypothetical protein [Tanacetum cinerariifolium]
GDDAPIKGRSLDEGEEAAERVSDDTEEMATILTSMDAASKETMVESDTPKKKKLQEQIDVQLARELEEEMDKDTHRINEQIARDAEIARIHAEEELQIMLDGLDRNNETVANAQIPDSTKKTSHKEAAERVLHFNTEEPGWMEGQAFLGDDTGRDKRKV